MTKLSVNLNKIAVLRNSRGERLPNIIEAARVVIGAGASGLTVHPRPDQRHIRPQDVRDLAAVLVEINGATETTSRVEYNIEGNPFAAASAGGYPGLMTLVAEACPDQVTLVPDNNFQLTSDHGFDLRGDAKRLKPIILDLRKQGVRVSLFMDADSPDIERAAEIGANRIEIFTGPYAHAFNAGDFAQRLQDCVSAAERARAAGLEVNAGHDLDQNNLPPLLEAIPFLSEASIGHALINDALYIGLAETVRCYLKICQRT